MSVRDFNNLVDAFGFHDHFTMSDASDATEAADRIGALTMPIPALGTPTLGVTGPLGAGSTAWAMGPTDDYAASSAAVAGIDNDNNTFGCWFLRDGAPSVTETIIAIGQAVGGAPDNGWGLRFSGGQLILVKWGIGESATAKVSQTAYIDGAWHFAVISRRAGSSFLIIDGVAVGSADASDPTAAATKGISAGAHSGAGNDFIGSMSDVIFHKTAGITDADCLALYRAGLAQGTSPLLVPGLGFGFTD